MEKDSKQPLPRGHVLRDSYRIDQVLGEGGFALTYLACHIGLNQRVAIKEYFPADSGVRSADGASIRARPGKKEAFQLGLARFAEEARTLATFDHRSIVSVADVFENNRSAYIVMEYVEGESLASRIQHESVIDETSLRRILEPILDALEVVHARGILHRDVKPENIHFRRNGCPVLLDFGNSMSSLEQAGGVAPIVLTPGFAPIELYSGAGKQGPWTDIYALGATLYQAITGTTPPEALDRIPKDGYASSRHAAGTGYSSALVGAIDRALAVRHRRRPQSIAEFRALLDAPPAVVNTLVPAGWANPPAHTVPAIQARPKRWATLHSMIGAVLLSAAMIGTGYAALSAHRQSEVLRIAAERAKQAEENAQRAREVARWHQLAEETARRRAAELARRRAIELARRRAIETIRRKAAEAAQRRVFEAKQRQARRQVVERRAAKKAPENQNGLLDGVRSFFQVILPR